MKKHVVILALLALQQLSVAQTVNVHFKNGQVIEYPSANVDYVDFSAKPQDPSVTEGEAIDLGLSVYWASCNLGALSPEGYGDYYAWGETKAKSGFSESNYAYYNESTKQYIDIGENISGTEYDAATVNLGSDWRMPTKDEILELINKCTWEWKQLKGRNGYMVTGKNGNSIFLPASGIFYSDWIFKTNENLYYWSGSNERALNGSSTDYYLGQWDRFRGLSIRPVTTNKIFIK